MSKDAYYFPHDSNARHDPKISAMTAVYGAKGYGWYWMIIELLREQKDYKYPLNTKYAFNVIGKELGSNTEEAQEFISDCHQEFGLFEMNDDYLWCESLNNRMKPLDARRKQAQRAAKKRWSNEEAEVEVEEKKEPKIVPPEKIKTLEVLQRDEYFIHLSKEICSGGKISAKEAQDQRVRCLDWLASKGRRYKDYRAFFRNWMRNVSSNKNNTKSQDGMVF